MKIAVTFDSLEEFNGYMGIQSHSGQDAQVNNCTVVLDSTPADVPAGDWTPGGGDPDQEFASRVEEPQERPREAQQKAAAGKPKSSTKKNEEPARAAAEADSKPVTEDFRIEVRKQLAALNRKAGYNRAAELIKEVTGTGAKLTEVSLADLPKIMAAAKEKIDAD